MGSQLCHAAFMWTKCCMLPWYGPNCFLLPWWSSNFFILLYWGPDCFVLPYWGPNCWMLPEWSPKCFMLPTRSPDCFMVPIIHVIFSNIPFANLSHDCMKVQNRSCLVRLRRSVDAHVYNLDIMSTQVLSLGETNQTRTHASKEPKLQ